MLAVKPDTATQPSLFSGTGLKYIDFDAMMREYPLDSRKNLEKMNEMIYWMMEKGHTLSDACFEVRVPVLAVCLWADHYPEVRQVIDAAYKIKNLKLLDKVSELREETQRQLYGFPKPDVKGVDIILKLIQTEIENKPTISITATPGEDGVKPFNVVLHVENGA